MRNMFVVAVIVGLGSALAGTFAAGQFAEAVPPPQAVIEQNKDANGLIRVHEQGTAGVRDLDNPAFQPFERLLLFAFDTPSVGFGSGQEVIDVPAGKRLVIEYVSAGVGDEDLTGATLSLDTSRVISGEHEGLGVYDVPLIRQQAGALVEFVGSENVRVYVGPSDPPRQING